MNQRLKNFILKLSILIILSMPAPLFAGGPALNNPLTSSTTSLSVNQVVANLIRTTLGLAGVIAVVFVIIGGARIAFAAGNEEQVSKGKKTLLYAILGTIIAFSGFLLVDFVIDTAYDALNLYEGVS